MKALTKTLLSLSVVAMLTTACEKDDKKDDNNNPSGKKELKIGGEAHTLGAGLLENYGTDTANYDGTNIDINMVTDGVTVYYDSDGEPDSLSGSGYLLWIESFSANPDDLKPGTYTFNFTDRGVGTFDDGAVIKITNGEEDTSEAYQVMGGSLEVSKTGNKYTIKGSLQTVDVNAGGSKAVSVDYTSEMDMVDYR